MLPTPNFSRKFVSPDEDGYQIGDYEIKIYFSKLESLEYIEAVDLTLYFNESKKTLQTIYHQEYIRSQKLRELKNFLLQDELQAQLF